MPNATEIMNQMFANDEFEWVDVDIDALPTPTKNYLGEFVILAGYAVKMHKEPIQGEYIFSVDHPTVKYLIHHPGMVGNPPIGAKPEFGSHMWGDENFDNIDGNTALAMLCSPDNPEETKALFDEMDEAVGPDPNLN